MTGNDAIWFVRKHYYGRYTMPVFFLWKELWEWI